MRALGLGQRLAPFLLRRPSPYVIAMGGGGQPMAVWAIIALGLLWLGVAIGLSILAGRRLRLAQDVLAAARSNATLLELTPARPLLVRSDQRIEMDSQLMRDLGLHSQPARISDLVDSDGGIVADDLAALRADIESAPFPMWYRGPDFRLGVVSSAFVEAVEGRDAAEVIERGLELIDAAGDDSAVESARTAVESGRIQSRMQPAIIRGEWRMLKIVNVPLPTGAVAGFAVDVQDLEDARTELARYIESQRELADRMTAGTAQFDGDRMLSFFNRPFAVMSQLDPDWLAEQPEFDRLIDRMRDNQRLPETRDFPAWKEERRNWFTSTEEVIEEEWMLPDGDHIRVVAQPLPDGGLRLFLEDRTEQLRLASARDTLLRVRAATFDNLYEAISVFASDGRLYLWNRRFIENWELDEEWLSEHPRVDELVPAMAKKLVNPTAAAQIR